MLFSSLLSSVNKLLAIKTTSMQCHYKQEHVERILFFPFCNLLVEITTTIRRCRSLWNLKKNVSISWMLKINVFMICKATIGHENNNHTMDPFVWRRRRRRRRRRHGCRLYIYPANLWVVTCEREKEINFILVLSFYLGVNIRPNSGAVDSSHLRSSTAEQ